MNPDRLLENLNQSQHAAVSSVAEQLAILAGPGSGKTHTLTSRTAWLLTQGLQPWNIIVATFTVKAAREMKERIGRLIGNGLESKIILGTFHSIARRYLARYGNLIGIPKGFGIADNSDSLAIIKRICKANNFNIEPKVAQSRISGKKARGGTPIEQQKNKSGAKSVELQEFERCYVEYEAVLKVSNLLDYDDLLLRCVDLLRSHPSCVSNVEAVLIDEFQDTNLVQFDLMRLFASQKKRITIVGDPDQSIYSFRAAEIKNYKTLLRQYPDTVTITLEENYRSSAAILNAALGVIEQDDSRVKKRLMATHTVGTRPVLRTLSGAHKEAEWIALEIQRCQGRTGGLMDMDDYAILLRSAQLSRLVETALGKAGIAYRMVGGLRFYDRIEIKTILDYLRVISHSGNNDALARIINTPSRRIGDGTIKSLLEEADRNKATLWSLILNSVQGKQNTTTKLQKPVEQNLSKLVNVILKAKKMVTDPSKRETLTVDVLKFVMEKIDYENWLEIHHGDVTKARWDNVQELITQATEYQTQIVYGFEDESLPMIDGLEQEEDDDPLARFLANVTLASSVKNDDVDGEPKPQVTISTIHAAKGLEWPVVFIPAAYEGSIPHSRAEDEDEERRLLYVAMTRAKALLYMSVPLQNSRCEETTLSPFLSLSSIRRLLETRGPSLGSSTVLDISRIVRRSCPTAKSIDESSSFLRSTEDDIFSEDGIDRFDSRWKLESDAGDPRRDGERAPKRQKVDLERSQSDVVQVSDQNWKTPCATTMDRAQSFTAPSTALGKGFVSVGTHFDVLNEQSINATLGNSIESSVTVSQKPLAKAKSKLPEDQPTIAGFFGKKGQQSSQCSKITTTQIRSRPQASGLPSIGASNRPRTSTANNRSHVIPSELASHRVGPSQIKARPKVMPTEEVQTHRRSEYVAFSSSPPRPPTRHNEQEAVLQPPEQPIASNTKPELMSCIRPAASFHKTTLTTVQNAMATKKTYGIKRNMNGWKGRSNASKEFKPPLRKN
ncbi:P-loop containing nucleoside triphosphate hydrolase protein [Amylocarpus encephaloides]|uniref:DNA 3'-5' helicase n=1 Tax=Amylocarpus encephaloides TaxID=45428 RepID=A0A9P8C458_9HELO|nr:P-loop containing nucleoside triphosphate hydrolase protein [Amylocarpus encephaloides]